MPNSCGLYYIVYMCMSVSVCLYVFICVKLQQLVTFV